MQTPNLELNHQTLPVIAQLAGQLPGGFVLYREGKTREILCVNQNLLDIFECATTEEFKSLTGYDFHGMVHPDDLPEVQNSINHQIKGNYGEYDHVEYRIITKNGHVRWVDDYGHFSSSEDYGDVFYVFIFDITEKRLAQEARNTFFYNMSHELLNPLNAVSTFIRLARSHTDDPQALQQYLTSAGEAADNMIRHIDKMLEIHREETDVRQTVCPPKDRTRVLIAEDNELNQLLLQTILEEAGILFETVCDGDQAVEEVRNRPAGYYSAVLMDIQMNVMNGDEATRQIRLLPGAGKEELPIIALSANSRPEDIENTRCCGMNDHLAKPYNPEQIVSTIFRYARQRGDR